MLPSAAAFRPVCKHHPLRSKAQRDGEAHGGWVALLQGAARGVPASLPDEDRPMLRVRCFQVLFPERGLGSPPLVRSRCSRPAGLGLLVLLPERHRHRSLDGPVSVPLVCEKGELTTQGIKLVLEHRKAPPCPQKVARLTLGLKGTRCGQNSARSPFKTEPELPSPGPALHAPSPDLGKFQQGQVTLGLGPSKRMCHRTVCRDNRKADLMTSRPSSRNFFGTNISTLSALTATPVLSG